MTQTFQVAADRERHHLRPPEAPSEARRHGDQSEAPAGHRADAAGHRGRRGLLRRRTCACFAVADQKINPFLLTNELICGHVI